MSRYGRFRIRPEAGTEYLSKEDAAQSENFLFDEVDERLAAPRLGQVPYLLFGTTIEE